MADTNTDTIPTMVVRPKPTQDGQGGTKSSATEWDGRKLSYGDMVNRWKARGYSDAGARGIADNMTRESGGNPTAIGPGGAAIGLFQHEGPRRTALEKFAKERGTSATDPDTQIDFADRELRTQYPKLREQLVSGTNRGAAEDQFKRVFERPASVLWGENRPKTESPDYRYSPYAMNEHAGRKNTDIVYMRPQDYLDLAPDLEEKPFTSPAGRSLLASVDKGEPIEAIPTLGMKVKGNTGEVTEQDGRHRALLAQHAGLDAIPVAITKTGRGDPTEIEGMSGKILPNNFPKAADVKKPDRAAERTDAGERSAAQSLWSKAAQAISPIGRAEAAEPQAGGIARTERPSDDGWEPVPEQPSPAEQGQSAAAPGQDGWEPVPTQSPQDDQQAAPDGMLMSAVKGAGAGLGRTVLAGQEMVGQGLKAAGATDTGKWLVDDARRGIGNLDKTIAPDQAAHPYATGAGEIGGSMALPGGIAGKIGGNALRVMGVGGALGGVLTPGSGDGTDYWTNKGMQTTAGAVGGVASGKAGALLGGMVAPTLRATVGRLMNEGVELTPGQMAGGAMKRAEDSLASVPILGSTIRAAQRRSIQTFNRAAINRSLADIQGQLPPNLVSGHDAIAYAEQAFSNAYNSVIPRMSGTLDNPMRADLIDIMNRAAAQNLPQAYQDQLRHVIKNEITDRLGAGGRISGIDAQRIGTQLDALIRPMRISDNPYVQHMGRLLSEADTALDAMMARNNPALQAQKDAIDAGYAKFKTVQRASTSAGAHPDGTFTPAQLSRSVLARDRSKDKAAFARGDALMQDLSSAARDVLPQTVPDSGTPERAALMATIGVGGTFQPHTAAALGMSALPYTAPVSRAMNAAVNRLAQQPGPTRNALAQILRRTGGALAPAAGSFAAGAIPTMTIHPGDGH